MWTLWLTHFYTIVKFKDMLQGRRRGELLEISSQKRLPLIFTEKTRSFVQMLGQNWAKKNGYDGEILTRYQIRFWLSWIKHLRSPPLLLLPIISFKKRPHLYCYLIKRIFFDEGRLALHLKSESQIFIFIYYLWRKLKLKKYCF